MKQNNTTTIDLFTGRKITRPATIASMMYDFDFKKHNENTWYYINSSNDISAFNKQADTVEERYGKWRIVEAKTGKIVKEN
jgi:hypothetical protein